MSASPPDATQHAIALLMCSRWPQNRVKHVTGGIAIAGHHYVCLLEYMYEPLRGCQVCRPPLPCRSGVGAVGLSRKPQPVMTLHDRSAPCDMSVAARSGFPQGCSMRAEEVAWLTQRPAPSLLASGPGTTRKLAGFAACKIQRLPLYSTQHHRGASDRVRTASSSSDRGDTAPKVIATMRSRNRMHVTHGSLAL